MSAGQTIGEPRVIYGRNAYVAEWTPDFSELELSTPVRQNGTALGFTIRDMLPERRWTVGRDGVLLDQLQFEQRYHQWVSRTVIGGKIINIRQANNYFDDKLAPIPLVARFASAKLDGDGREIAIGFNPDKAPEKHHRFEMRDGEGRTVDPLTSRKTTQLDQVTQIEDLVQRGVLSEEAAKAERARILLGEQIVEVKVEAKPEVMASLTKCGKQARSAAGKAAHERACKQCQALDAPTQVHVESEEAHEPA